MMKAIIISILALLFVKGTMAQHKPAYVLYSAKGKKVSYGKMIKKLVKNDIVLIGEFHNNPISHWLELEITRDCFQQRKLVLGAEMFEQDNQPALDLYLQGKLSPRGLDSMARLWSNYTTDYAPLVNFARDNQLRFAASNVPRRYASMVSKYGFEVLDTLTAAEKLWMAPLPIHYDANLPGYKHMMTMMAGHGSANMPRAQALKDATMAHFILQYFVPGNLFIHYNGSYHSDNYDGIVWHLRQRNAALRIATVTTVVQADIHRLLPENNNRADFIICVDDDMTTTY